MQRLALIGHGPHPRYAYLSLAIPLIHAMLVSGIILLTLSTDGCIWVHRRWILQLFISRMGIVCFDTFLGTMTKATTWRNSPTGKYPNGMEYILVYTSVRRLSKELNSTTSTQKGWFKH